jgi:hypothetical protein
MPGGGLISLVAYGAQNVILSGNPQMTYFYKAFKRYTHFAMENITVPLEGPNELFYDQPIRLRAKIPRYADLLSDMYFSFRIPDIYSKYLNPKTQTNGRIAQYEFEWVQYLGAAIIQTAAFFVGGQKIQEITGQYMVARALLDYDTDTLHKWNKIVGTVPELMNPASGLFAGGSSTIGYPTVIPDSTQPDNQQVNRPSIFGREIHVPLAFWFTESPGLSLPLVGLQYHECELQLTLAPINQLYTVLDASGYRCNPEFVMRAPLLGIQSNLPEYASAPDMSGEIRNFFVDFGFTVPPLDGWFLNPRLQCSYIYLPKEEQQLFASRPLSYLMQQITQYQFPGIFNRQLLDLETHNPITRLVIVPQRSDARERNDFSNFTNWAFYPKPPFIPPPGTTALQAYLQTGYSSGLFVPNAQLNILRSIRVLCDGNEIQEVKNIDFFNDISQYKYTKGVGSDGLPIYTFELMSPGGQPSGSINASRIRKFQVELDVYPLPAETTYVYDVNIYVENINWFEVASGMGGLKYAL